MPLQSIIVVFLRLSAISSVLTSTAYFGIYPQQYRLAALSLEFIFASGCWFLAPFIAKLVSAGYDAVINFTALTRKDLYSFAFVYVGLGAVIHAFPALAWSIATVISDKANERMQNPDYYENLRIPQYSVEFVLGVALIIFASSWAKMIIKRESELI